eukprot:16429651-Heterocapsa_arctica.AAC.1
MTLRLRLLMQQHRTAARAQIVISINSPSGKSSGSRPAANAETSKCVHPTQTRSREVLTRNMASLRTHIPSPPEVSSFRSGGSGESSWCGPGREFETRGPLPGVFAVSSGSGVTSESPGDGSGREVAAPRSFPGWFVGLLST